MALKIDYVAKETGRNLFRNPWLTVATVLTVFVSVTFVGLSLLIREGFANATARWQEGVEFIVYMQPDATQDQIDSVGRDLDENPQVASADFFDKDDSYAEFVDLFADNPEFIQNITPDALPTSYRVRPVTADSTTIDGLTTAFREKPGVREVVAANDAIRFMDRVTNVVSIGTVALAGATAVASVVLIGNTIQTAIFARRREIEVMKLVGATNWFIRVPFMLEGIVQGVIGSALGIGGVYAINSVFDRVLRNDDAFGLFSNFVVASDDVFLIAIGLLVGGILMGAVTSAVAVTFYVNV